MTSKLVALQDDCPRCQAIKDWRERHPDVKIGGDVKGSGNRSRILLNEAHQHEHDREGVRAPAERRRYALNF